MENLPLFIILSTMDTDLRENVIDGISIRDKSDSN